MFPLAPCSGYAPLLARYDAEVRARPIAPPGLSVDMDRGVTTLVGYFNFVSSWTLSPTSAQDVVSDFARRFRARGEALMWHVYDHDEPRNLQALLAAEGFVAEQTATLMMLKLDDASGLESAGDETDIRMVRDLVGLRDFVEAGGRAFGAEDHWQMEAFRNRLADPHLGLFVAYVDGAAAASGRLEADPASGFGELFGGGVAPELRRRGLYRRLVRARAEYARTLGLDCLVTSARETSRPILEALGFDPVGRKTCWVLKPS